MQKDWMKSSVSYTLVNEDHKKGVKHSFSNVAQDVKPEIVGSFGKILESLIVGDITDASITSTDHVDIDEEPATAPTTPATPTASDGTVAKKGEAVYSLKKIYMYKNNTFKKSERIASYAKKPRVNRPMFVVADYARSQQGKLRYVVRDVNHHSKTYGKQGVITANWSYVRPVYYQSSHKTLTVINPRGINEYKNKDLTGKVRNYKQGTQLKVKGFVNHNLTTRYLLSNGHYVTGNRKLVIAGKYKQPKQIKVKKSLYRYNDANFDKRINKIKRGTVLTVKKWDYSHQYSTSNFGAKRYQVAGGYVTANNKYVEVVK